MVLGEVAGVVFTADDVTIGALVLFVAGLEVIGIGVKVGMGRVVGMIFVVDVVIINSVVVVIKTSFLKNAFAFLVVRKVLSST